MNKGDNSLQYYLERPFLDPPCVKNELLFLRNFNTLMMCLIGKLICYATLVTLNQDFSDLSFCKTLKNVSVTTKRQRVLLLFMRLHTYNKYYLKFS